MIKHKATLKTLMIAGLMSGVSTIAMAQSQSGLSIAENDSVYVDAKTFSLTPGKGKGDAAAQVKVLGARSLDAGAIIFRAGNKLYIADAVPLDVTASAQYAIPSSNAYGPNYAYGADRNVIIPSSNAYGPNYAYGTDRNVIIPSSNAYGPNYAYANVDRTIAYPNGMVVPNPADRFAVYANNPADRNTIIPSSNAYGPNYAYGPDRNVIIPSSNAYGPNYAYGVDRSITYPSGMVVPNPADRFAVYANNPTDRNAIIPSSNAYGPNYAVVPNPADRFAVYVNDPDYVQYRLKKEFEDNWIPTLK